MKTITLKLLTVLLLLLPCVSQAAEVTDVRLPAGDYVHTGKYFPLLVTLRETEQPGQETEVLVSLGSLTFARSVSVTPGTSRKVLMWVMTTQEHPQMIIEVRSPGKRLRYPQMSRSVTDRLRVLPRREHLVGIVSSGPEPELRWLFQHDGITKVQLSARLDFPEEVFRNFDLIAFKQPLWSTLEQPVQEAIEKYVKSGGNVYISEHEDIPFGTTQIWGGEIISSSIWGLGRLFLLSQQYRLSKVHLAKLNEVKEKILSAQGLLVPRRHDTLTFADASKIFEPQPRYFQARPRWAVFLLVSCLALAAAALCGLLRIWQRRAGLILMPALACLLSASFVFVAPFGSVGYESLFLISTAVDSKVALERKFVQLYSFADADCAKLHLGADGLIVPVALCSSGRARPSPLLYNGTNASISGLQIRKDGACVFEVRQNTQLEEGFESSPGKSLLRITNNSGFDLRDCVLISDGMVSELGNWPFGRALEPNPYPPVNREHFQAYLARRFDSRKRRDRVLASFAEYAWKRFLKRGRVYITGWSQTNEKPPPGYAETVNMGTMWIIDTGQKRY